MFALVAVHCTHGIGLATNNPVVPAIVVYHSIRAIVVHHSIRAIVVHHSIRAISTKSCSPAYSPIH
jgi:hypothetical protein